MIVHDRNRCTWSVDNAHCVLSIIQSSR